jgi:hypothetical protein
MKKFLLIIVLCIVSIGYLHAKNETIAEDKLNEWLPTLLGTNNSGTEYYFTFHPCWEVANSQNFLKVYVACGVETEVTVSVEGKGYSETKKTIANDIIVFNIPPSIGQVYRKNDRDHPETDQVWESFGIHVEAGAPIICYGMTRYMYTSDGFLAIPTTSIGKEYVVSSWTDIGDNGTGAGQYLSSYSSAVAAFDNTNIRFTCGGPSFSTTASGMKVGETKTYQLNKGDVLLIASRGQYSDLSGSAFEGNKPFSVISGNYCSYVPEQTPACDFMIEQDLPISSWGKEYHVTPIINKKKYSWVKIYAAEDNTTIYRDGKALATLTKGGGGVLDEAYINLRASDDENEPLPLLFSADKPISVTQYNTGQLDDGVPSDPFQMVLTPTQQFQNDIIFATPGFQGDGFANNYINIVYEAGPDGLPANFQIAEVVNGEFVWTDLLSYSPGAGQPFYMPDGGKRMFSKTIKLEHDGVYKLQNSTPFGAYAYGFSNYDSYGYPVFAGLGNATGSDPTPPSIGQVYIDENGVVRSSEKGNSILTLKDNEGNSSHISKIIADPYLSSNFKLEVDEYIPGEETELNWSASVVDKSKSGRLVLRFSDMAGNTATESLVYSPKDMQIACDDVTFLIESEDLEYKKTVSVNNPGNDAFEITAVEGPFQKRQDDGTTLVFDCKELMDDLQDGPIVVDGKSAYQFDVVFQGIPTLSYQDEITIVTNGATGKNTINFSSTSLVSVIDAEDGLEFQFYPNPTTGVLNITSKENTEIIEHIEVFDVAGNLVGKFNNIHKADYEMNLSNLNVGTYVLHLMTSKSTYIKKITLTK